MIYQAYFALAKKSGGFDAPEGYHLLVAKYAAESPKNDPKYHRLMLHHYSVPSSVTNYWCSQTANDFVHQWWLRLDTDLVALQKRVKDLDLDDFSVYYVDPFLLACERKFFDAAQATEIAQKMLDCLSQPNISVADWVKVLPKEVIFAFLKTTRDVVLAQLVLENIDHYDFEDRVFASLLAAVYLSDLCDSVPQEQQQALASCESLLRSVSVDVLFKWMNLLPVETFSLPVRRRIVTEGSVDMRVVAFGIFGPSLFTDSEDPAELYSAIRHDPQLIDVALHNDFLPLQYKPGNITALSPVMTQLAVWLSEQVTTDVSWETFSKILETNPNFSLVQALEVLEALEE